MLRRYKIPKTILWVINLFLLFLLLFTLFRLATFFAFRPADLGFMDTLASFSLGLQYDLRWISLLLLPIILASLSMRLSPFYSARNKKWWTWYLVLVTFIVFFFFAADFGSFSYNQTRLDAGAMNFVEDPGISLEMMWQTYPMIWMLLGLLVTVIIFRWMYRKSHWRVISQTDGLKIPYRRKYFVIAALLLAALVHGKLSLQPLTWKECFVFRDNFKSYLALNPLQNFFSTLRLRKPEFNENKAREVFPIMARWMPLPEPERFGYERLVTPYGSAIESRPNIVLVMCESFSMYKSSMSGNPLNTTPYFDSISRKGIFFEKCFTPHFSTARGLFALITGIPDAQLFKFSTRNPLAIRQKTIIDNFPDYSKHYFLGGDPDFNNFKGLLENIDGLQMHTGTQFSAPKVNVWGISDKDLFLEANKVFRREDSSFFAIIQTSFNHRPFMIPEGDSDFERKYPDRDTLLRYGFESVEEYNSFRYSDYCFRSFLEAAQKEAYFHNTIFVFVGDHGVAGNAAAMYPPAWTEQRLTDEHVPLLFYAPYLLAPQRRPEVVSQIDVLPTIAGMLHQPYINSTLGRDLLHPDKQNHYAFITNTAGRIGIVTDQYYFNTHLNFPDDQLVPITELAPGQSPQQQDSIRRELAEFTHAFFETARYLLMNNRPE